MIVKNDGTGHPFYYFSLVLVSVIIVMQIAKTPLVGMNHVRATSKLPSGFCKKWLMILKVNYGFAKCTPDRGAGHPLEKLFRS